MKMLLAATVIALIPLAGIAGGDDPAAVPQAAPDRTEPGTSTEQPVSFDQLDANRDGRISMPEASADPKLVESFSTADKNGDGYLDATEFANAIDTPPPRQ